MKVIFECNENMNQFKKEVEFDDDITDELIEEEFKTWVWEQVGDYYCWYKKLKHDSSEG